ncbi:PREDICTED: zinc finger protein 184-like [Cyprinodon variegatus]|uniref:Zinc finger protein 184-like n=1 Tax=Cyprinodon variegatus TaxID=28743 RepID=A0A3Q2EAD4_CYPVA|nr:PREDICTED: zinc finger protein 184-like [Cyprinodon variegatus]
MKPQLLGGQGPVLAPLLRGSDAMRSIQEELVAAIHGALEAAVEIAVREVRTLVGQATLGMHEELRRENESLKEKLQRAEQLLHCVTMEEDDGSDRQRDGAPHPASCGPNTVTPEVRGQPAGGQSCLGLDHRDVSRPSDRDRKQPDTDGQKTHKDVLKIEGVTTPCRNLQAPESEAALRTSLNSTLEQVTIKQEEPEEERTPICLDVVKDESLVSDSINWPSEGTDIRCQDPKAQVLDERVDQARPPNISSSLTSNSDLQLISPEFSNIFHLEPASVSQALPQVQESHIKSGRSSTTIPTCKLCGQTFPLPSLLRRHFGQCSLRLQQRGQPPQGGGTKTRLQLHPPGWSPFRCTVCSRDFNRLENLKTHLRIHTGERPYTCSVCLKCFRHSGALTRHFRIHTGEKPYVCGQCGKSFRNCGGLKFHQRTHSKDLQ